ncbi:MAG: hypothetical protein NTX24_02730 [Candidatus Pacearchaeota archaeon]|nr:hypothetical protein [Candidatus Pacearchaeota archaeon]
MKTKQSVVFYMLLAVFLLILGFIYKEWFCFVGAGIIGICAFYWIWKSIKQASDKIKEKENTIYLHTRKKGYFGGYEFVGYKKGKRILKPIYYKQPLYTKGNDTYWKGTRVGDDLFDKMMSDPKELRTYNYWVRRLNRRNRKKKI